MKIVSGKSCREKYFVFSNFLFFENRTVYEVLWKIIVEPDRPQMTVGRMRIADWIPKATNTHSA
jgi:hypothetical protein